MTGERERRGRCGGAGTLLAPVLCSCFGAGAALTLAVAAPLALDRAGWWPGRTTGPDTFWTDGERGGHYVRTRHPLRESIDFRRIIFVGRAEDQPYFERDKPPSWAAVLSIDLREGYEEVETIVTGWPFRAMRMERWQSWGSAARPPLQLGDLLLHDGTLRAAPASNSDRVRGGMVTIGRAGLEAPIPLSPMWPGLLTDIAVFAGAGLLLGLAPARCRAILRRRRGLCPACGYDRRGVEGPCPECGRAA
ncbi:MAG: hypothetical protein IPJ41_03085 [Phycisphaerales bacterium]|nr:hypothetical protein [Phycisphaerales bacterium]